MTTEKNTFSGRPISIVISSLSKDKQGFNSSDRDSFTLMSGKPSSDALGFSSIYPILVFSLPSSYASCSINRADFTTESFSHEILIVSSNLYFPFNSNSKRPLSPEGFTRFGLKVKTAFSFLKSKKNCTASSSRFPPTDLQGVHLRDLPSSPCGLVYGASHNFTESLIRSVLEYSTRSLFLVA